MIRHTYESVVSTSPEHLFRAIADIASWPAWDHELESVEPPSAVVAGTGFALTPKGGPRVRMTIESVEANRRFVDVSHLPLAKMRTSHEFTPEAGGTRVRLTIEVSGPLAFLWDRIVARKQAAGAQAQTAAFARYAEGS
ncbi:MAG: SRPBCC family protein [Polyangiaceae bacterium]